jgi:hypothetical protein
MTKDIKRVLEEYQLFGSEHFSDVSHQVEKKPKKKKSEGRCQGI